MTVKLQIQTRVRRLIHYIEDITKGLIQVPEFQRDFVWEYENKKDLFDSIKRGYPIGSILFWRPDDESFGRNSEMGPFKIPEPNGEYMFILDGFQRLSTLFGCLINPTSDKTKLPINEEKWRKEFNICYDLEKEEFFIPRSLKLEFYQVHVYDLIDTRSSFKFQRDLFNLDINEERIQIYSDRYEKLGTTLIDYQLPSIDIYGGKIDEAVEIFSRVNSTGTSISPDWMISALTYNKDKNFRLGSVIDKLYDDLSIFNFTQNFSIKRELIFNCITNSFGKAYFDQSNRIEDLAKRDDFIPTTLKTIESIKKAVQFLFEELLVLNGRLLPYGPQLIFITDFFNIIKNPTQEQIEQLKKWFWITTYSGYFTMYSLSKVREAYNVFQKFLREETDDPIFNDKPEIPFSVSEFPNKIYMGSVRAKALVLYLLNYSNNFQRIDLDNSDGLILSFLFHDSKDEKGNFLPESVVPMIENEETRRYKKMKDVSDLLANFTYKDSKYLISDEMVLSFKAGNVKEVLRLRKDEIIKKESLFAHSLGLKSEY
jgi:uncharacterized protein with ParB-like and HNH nuclease domain